MEIQAWELTDRLLLSFEVTRIGPVGRRREPVRYFIYEMKDYLQRAYIASEIVILPNREEVLAALGKASLKDLKSKVYFAKEDAEGFGNILTTGEKQNKILDGLNY